MLVLLSFVKKKEKNAYLQDSTKIWKIGIKSLETLITQELQAVNEYILQTRDLALTYSSKASFHEVLNEKTWLISPPAILAEPIQSSTSTWTYTKATI